jgi:hypothetical protein
MACAHLKTCPLYALFAGKDPLRVWQIHYCEGRFEECARLKLAQAGKNVPRDLLPNGKRLASGALKP